MRLVYCEERVREEQFTKKKDREWWQRQQSESTKYLHHCCCRAFCSAYLGNCLRIIGRTKHTRARYKRVGASLNNLVRIVTLDTSIDLDPGVQAALIGHVSNGLDFRNYRFNEALATESGVDGHDENEIAELKHVFNCGCGGGWVENDTGLAAEISDEVERSVEVNSTLTLAVDGDDVGASVGELGDDEVGFDNHEVNIEGFASDWAESVDDERADGDVGHESTVHDVDVNPVAAGLIDGANLVTQLGEVCGENRRGYDDLALLWGWHVDRGARGEAACVGCGDGRLRGGRRKGGARKDGGGGDGGGGDEGGGTHCSRRCCGGAVGVCGEGGDDESELATVAGAIRSGRWWLSWWRLGKGLEMGTAV